MLALASFALIPALQAAPGDGRAAGTAREIARELAKPNRDPGGWPLPVMGHWAAILREQHFSSLYQASLLERGHRVMPTLPMPDPGDKPYSPEAKALLEKLARWGAPVTFRAGQWESVLMDKSHPVGEPGKWRNLPPEKSPLVKGAKGFWITPWGPIEPWIEAGRYTVSGSAMKEIQEIYPDPPRVILLSNNEARILKPKVDLGAEGIALPSEVAAKGKRRGMIEGYVERYGALLKAMREALASEAWRKNALMVGYGAFGPPHFGRMGHWTQYSFATDERVQSWHLAWDGGSPSYYTHNWNASTDYRVWSPQVESQNWIFMLEEAYRERPEFWFEVSVWDGNTGDAEKRKKNAYLKAGQRWSPERYAGYVQFGMWLLRPRVVREFRGSTCPRAEFQKDFEAAVAAVDRVWYDPVLQRFWRHGALVPNRAHPHPYQEDIPDRWKSADRWFMLDTSLDPARPWKLDTELPVFSLARSIGERGRREWLVYAHSPLQDRSGVEIRIPDYGKVSMDVSVGGSFALVREEDGSVSAVRPPAGPGK